VELKYFIMLESPELKAKTRNEVAEEYSISVRTLYRWLKSAGILTKRGLIKPNELQKIYELFGTPKKNRLG
jgi:DNA invertase Pin-like site-specific DNA recombinase